jgi:hypothetical protein
VARPYWRLCCWLPRWHWMNLKSAVDETTKHTKSAKVFAHNNRQVAGCQKTGHPTSTGSDARPSHNNICAASIPFGSFAFFVVKLLFLG